MTSRRQFARQERFTGFWFYAIGAAMYGALLVMLALVCFGKSNASTLHSYAWARPHHARKVAKVKYAKPLMVRNTHEHVTHVRDFAIHKPRLHCIMGVCSVRADYEAQL